MYRVTEKRTIEIVRILHDRMDFRRHISLPIDDSGE
jgi:toxin ParE1/3/4